MGLTPETRRVVVKRSISLSAVAAAYLLNVTKDDRVELSYGQADKADLEDPSVICISVCYSGDPDLGNFCRYNPPDGPTKSAALQTFDFLLNGGGEGIRGIPGIQDRVGLIDIRKFIRVANLIRFIDEASARRLTFSERSRPNLWDVFGGLLLTERDPMEQLHKGIEILRAIIESGQDPYGPLSGFDEYVAAKAARRAEVRNAANTWRSRPGS